MTTPAVTESPFPSVEIRAEAEQSATAAISRVRAARFLPDGLCLLVLFVFALAACAPVLEGRVPVAADVLSLGWPQHILNPQPVHNQMLGDSGIQMWPWQVFVRRSIANGEWPLWNPHNFSGHPFLWNAQAMLYYPINWLLLPLPLSLAFQLFAILHVWLAGTGMYFWARTLGASRTGSVLSGLGFAGGGMLITGLEIIAVAGTYIWLPWIVTAAELALRRHSWAWTAAASLLFGVLAVAGHLQWFLYSAVFLVVWLAARLAWMVVRPRLDPLAAGPDRRDMLAQVARAAVIPLWGLALGAVQLLPFFEMYRLASRGAHEVPFVAPLDLEYMLGRVRVTLFYFVPRFGGDPVDATGNSLGPYTAWYAGLVSLALAIVALALVRRPRVWLLGGVGLLSWGVALSMPIVDRLHQLPGLAALPAQRTGYLLTFTTAAMAGLGFDALLSLARRRPLRTACVVALLAVIALLVGNTLLQEHAKTLPQDPLLATQASALRQAALIAAALFGWLAAVFILRGDRSWWRRAALAGMALGIVFVDLLTYAPNYNTYVRPEQLEVSAPGADFMLADPEPWRMMPVDEGGIAFGPDTGLLYGSGLPDVAGYDSLHLTRYEDYWAPVEPAIRDGSYFNVFLRPQSYDTNQADLLNVKYVVTPYPLATAVEQPFHEVSTVELAGEPIAQTFRAPPRLWKISVAFDALDRVNQAPVTLRIRRNITDTADLAVVTKQTPRWQGQPWIEFVFPTVETRRGEPLVMVLESAQGAGHSVAVRTSSTDVYSGGDLYRRGTRYGRDIAFAAEGKPAARLELVYDGEVKIYRNNRALPRAFVVGATEVLPAAEIPRRIADPAFDPRRTLLLEEAPPPGFVGERDDGTPPGRATVTEYRNLSVEVEARMDRPGWLVLGDVNYPGWQVTVDGETAPLYTAYSIVRAVPLAAGTHRVRFEFRPSSVLAGGAVSLGALALALGTLGYGTVRRRKPGAPGRAPQGPPR